MEPLTLDEYRDHTKALYVKFIEDGWVISVHRYTYSDRVCLGRIEHPYGYEDGWCYPDRALAMRAAFEWDGKGDPPDGWVKQLSTDRCRVDGDPARESIGWKR